ncbi:hypothetical protein GH714_039070 [Hevea brasiliensis]|uniref:Major facilitator superfamily (MFS) profile domain-containing protein n=1 Tax=Hevea brasiliensis TaxID=3981 RepID=A0A6A6MNN9_HEVBR|nr:hypothetical protein GH714_039070 [Hevea brasiliensis]
MIELGQPNESQGRVCNGCTGDGSLDRHGKPALKGATGGWRCGIKLLETVLVYLENMGYWVLGFWICAACAVVGYVFLVTKRKPKPPSELQRMGIGLAGVTVAMIVAGIVERQRRIHAANSDKETSSLGILWQAPQYILMGTSEAFVYVAQMQFFASQTPDALKSLGISLSMSSTAIGSYIYSMILTLVMAITARNGKPGWVPSNLNHGHLERYFFLSAALIALNLVLFVISAKRFKFTSFEKPDLEATNASTSL